jgi:ABC-2 type transport system ATP-binding protein
VVSDRDGRVRKRRVRDPVATGRRATGGGRRAITPAIETWGLTKTYRSTRAVADLDLRIERGEVFGFLGPNGAGKTTTIRMLLALQRPTAGRACVLGFDPQRHGVEIHRRMGYLPGDLELYPRSTARQHLEWFAQARGERSGDYAQTLLDRFGVVTDRPTKELSKGNRQKVGLVLAFMHRPELLILDEPTSGLDPLVQNEFEQLVRETAADGATVFLSSHELDEVQRLADQVAIIRSGRLVATDTVERLRSDTPHKLEVTFAVPIDPAVFAGVDGVTVNGCDDARVSLEVTGPIAPVLEMIAPRHPIDLVSRHATLDELFLDYYRNPPTTGSTDGH